MHSTGLYDLENGIYVSHATYGLEVPASTRVTLELESGESIDLASIKLCPMELPHHHFTLKL